VSARSTVRVTVRRSDPARGLSADTNRGFGFVQFEHEGDAAAALDNMDGTAPRC
jgi:RNA recognition motif-containing protein